MSFSPPTYIPIELIAQAAIQFEWDDWDPFSKVDWPDESTKYVLDRVSNNASIAFSVGCAEWVVYRSSHFFKTSEPFEYLEAFWVTLSGVDEALPYPTENEDWIGPVRGSINLALMTALNSFYLSEDGAPTQNSAFSAQIALYVLTKKEEFLDWQGKILARLKKYFPRDPEHPDGSVVPREILDPRFEFSQAQIDNLTRTFLDRVNWQDNRFLVDIEKPR